MKIINKCTTNKFKTKYFLFLFCKFASVLLHQVVCLKNKFCKILFIYRRMQFIIESIYVSFVRAIWILYWIFFMSLQAYLHLSFSYALSVLNSNQFSPFSMDIWTNTCQIRSPPNENIFNLYFVTTQPVNNLFTFFNFLFILLGIAANGRQINIVIKKIKK